MNPNTPDESWAPTPRSTHLCPAAGENRLTEMETEAQKLMVSVCKHNSVAKLV